MSFERQIHVVIKEPGMAAREELLFENTLEAFQKQVGGYIETITLMKDMALIVNEEGVLRGLPYNCNFIGLPIVGPVVAVGVKGENFASLPTSCVPTIIKELNRERDMKAKLNRLIGEFQSYGSATQTVNGALADFLIANGVRIATDNNVGDKGGDD